MRVPIRKPGKYTFLKPDPNLTEEKFKELQQQLERLRHSQPAAIAEVSRLAQMGDFSENAAYQMAKGRLRGINQRILDLENHLKRAVVITPSEDTSKVQLGHRVTISMDGQQTTFTILGSSETDPGRGVISHNSPIGSALLGKRVGETVVIRLAKKEVECKVVEIN